MNKAFVNWSSGKDAAYACWQVLQQNKLPVHTLLTTLSEQYNRISMHGVREEMLNRQAESMGLPLKKIYLPENADMQTYETIMGSAVKAFKNQGYTHAVFGDIFLEDLRKYREEKLGEHDIQCVFPLWHRPTPELLKDMLDAGFKMVIACVSGKHFDGSVCGRVINYEFLNHIPKGVDTCGENGEFHTFVFDGPIFRKPVTYQLGEIVERSYPATEQMESHAFWYADLLPV